jgi:hypothetical protein
MSLPTPSVLLEGGQRWTTSRQYPDPPVDVVLRHRSKGSNSQLSLGQGAPTSSRGSGIASTNQDVKTNWNRSDEQTDGVQVAAEGGRTSEAPTTEKTCFDSNLIPEQSLDPLRFENE